MTSSRTPRLSVSNLGLALVVLGSTAIAGCGSLQREMGAFYRAEMDYPSLYWLESNWLESGKSVSEIKGMLGEHNRPRTELFDYLEQNQLTYTASYEDVQSRHLIIRFSDDWRVTDWEWASE